MAGFNYQTAFGLAHLSAVTLKFRMLASVLASVLPLCSMSFADERTGEEIYMAQCAKCHGDKGQGDANGYASPLVGDRSVLELASIIEKTMPEDDPSQCVGEDAHKVAAYIHDAFYSPIAQARNKPARIELSRLTVRQYQNVITDLIGSFRRPGELDEQQGLKAEYYKNRRFRTDDRVLERIDSQVNFDFGTASPVPEKTEDHEFSIRWEGSLFAPETGDYEIIVRTDHAARLWLNNLNQPLIDAWVKSGADTEFKASITLLGGRTYPLKLEFSKAKQGVDDSDKQKEKPPSPPAFVKLLWKVPHRVEEVIPARCLSTSRMSELFVLNTPFPPDDKSGGWVRGTSVSKEWDKATTNAAYEVAGYVSERIDELAGVRQRRGRSLRSPSDGGRRRERGAEDNETADSMDERTQKLREFTARFVERAFRRPLTDEERQLYIEAQFAAEQNPDIAVKRVVLLTLKSPWFLYSNLEANVGSGSLDNYDVATRLSLSLWDSLPDEELLKAAAEGKLTQRDEVAAQAKRMIDDPRTKSKIRQFLLGWLKADEMHDLSKDPEQYGEFTPEIASDLKTSLELMLGDVVWSESSDFRELLLADSLYFNGRLAKFYGLDLPEDAVFQKVTLDPDKRAGVLTHPLLLSGFAYTSETSPIHRGVFVARSVLGRSLRPPPVAVAPLAPDLHPDLTTRERVILQTKAQACAVCHTMINPLGFTLENFDAVGRFRAEERGRTIDASGGYLTRDGKEVKFTGAREMASFLANSDEVHAAFVQQLFHHLVKQPINAFGLQQGEILRQSFVESGFNIRQLIGEIAVTAALHENQGQSTAGE